MQRACRVGFTLSSFVVVMALCGWLRATALAPNGDLTVEGEGLTLASAGIGLEGLGAGTETITIFIGGPVQAARLFWAGRDMPCPQDASGACVIPGEPYLDQQLLFDGNAITGTIIGSEGQAPNSLINNIGYATDVTAIVQAKGEGLQDFTIADGNLASNLARLNGAVLVVVYTDESDPTHYQLVLYEGLDFAFGRSDQLAEAQVTSPVTFNYDAFEQDRTAELTIMAGDAEPDRPDRIDISDNPSLVNQLVENLGPELDLLVVGVNVPAGTSSTTVQLFSEPLDQNPDSLLWVLGALRVPIAAPGQGCRVTGGGVDTSGQWDQTLASSSDNSNGNGNINRYQFGGQAGAPRSLQPQPSGEWTHHQQRGPDGNFTFHAGTASAPAETEIDRITCSDPESCVPARTAPFKQIDFEGVGTFKNMKNPSAALGGVIVGETFHWFSVHIEDLGEPGRGGKQDPPIATCPPEGSAGAAANCDCPDYYRITIYADFDPATEEPNKTDVIYQVRGYVDGGNLQIHPSID